MDRTDLLAKIASGNAKVGDKLGVECMLYRPNGASDPVASGNFIANLSVYFEPANKLQVLPEWIGTFDFSLTLQGDYLAAAGGGVYFIAAQTAFSPVVCIETNASFGMTRPVAADDFGASNYSAVGSNAAIELIAGWPGYLAISGRAKDGEAENNMGLAAWEILLPVLPVVPLVADLVTDNSGRIFVVTAAERTLLGWTLHVKQASS